MRRILMYLFAIIVLALRFVALGIADPFEEAVAAYEAGDYVTAFRLQRSLADKGFAKAQLELGIMYAYGQGVPQNDAEAAKWIRKAADQGDALAQHNLGVFYDNGRGVPQDRIDAVKWYRKAADQGLADAQYDLGHMYAVGQGVPRDHVRAYMWFTLSAAQGYQRAVQNRSQLARQMIAAEIAKAEKLAREWEPKKQRIH